MDTKEKYFCLLVRICIVFLSLVKKKTINKDLVEILENYFGTSNQPTTYTENDFIDMFNNNDIICSKKSAAKLVKIIASNPHFKQRFKSTHFEGISLIHQHLFQERKINITAQRLVIKILSHFLNDFIELVQLFIQYSNRKTLDEKALFAGVLPLMNCGMFDGMLKMMTIVIDDFEAEGEGSVKEYISIGFIEEFIRVRFNEILRKVFMVGLVNVMNLIAITLYLPMVDGVGRIREEDILKRFEGEHDLKMSLRIGFW